MLGQTQTQRIADVTAGTAATAEFKLDLNLPVLNGVVLKVDVGYASGTSPTLDLTLQTTADGGSSWLDLAALTQIVAATTNSVFVPLSVAEPAIIAGPVGALTLSAGQVSHLPLLSKGLRLYSRIGGTAAYFNYTADLLINEVPSIS